MLCSILLSKESTEIIIKNLFWDRSELDNVLNCWLYAKFAANLRRYVLELFTKVNLVFQTVVIIPGKVVYDLINQEPYIYGSRYQQMPWWFGFYITAYVLCKVFYKWCWSHNLVPSWTNDHMATHTWQKDEGLSLLFSTPVLTCEFTV